MLPSLLVFDDWLDPPVLEAVHALVEAHFRSRSTAGNDPIFSWYSPKQARHVCRLPAEQRRIAERYIDGLMARLGPILACEPEGYEWWSNFGNTLEWHMDKDELLYSRERVLRTPLWSTVLYTQVSIRGRGGELNLLGDTTSLPYLPDLTAKEVPQKIHSISPRTNRLVVFRSGVHHRIDPFQGIRASLAMNVWGTMPIGVERYGPASDVHPLEAEDAG